MNPEIVTINVRSFESALDAGAVTELEQILPQFIQTQRWYRAKAKTIASLAVQDTIRTKKEDAYVLIVRVDYTDGESDTYLFPLALADNDRVERTDVVAKVRAADGTEKSLHGGLSSTDFRSSLLDAIACDDVFEGSNGTLVTERTNAFDRQCGQWVPELESKVSRAEQSNSSIIFGTQYILKVFRKLESGVNPDIEIGKFLTAQGFAHTPPVLGQIEYRPKNGEPMHAGILQGFVANEGDAWNYTLESLSGFFERALRNSERAPALESYHPFHLKEIELSPIARQIVGEYLESAHLLGTRTAQMHAALASASGNPDFDPEPFTPKDSTTVSEEMQHEADRAFRLLREKEGSLTGEAKDAASKLLTEEHALREKFSQLRNHPITAVRIRHHGDYHLGQVLYTGHDFVIIDFEGEPARPLAARRAKALAMRDVAGMIRSFSYAAYAALFGQVSGVSPNETNKAGIESWAAFWSATVSAEYLRSYFREAQAKPFVSATEEEAQMLLDAFVLQKAFYEVAYEMNNRPDWVQIPLRGILTLID